MALPVHLKIIIYEYAVCHDYIICKNVRLLYDPDTTRPSDYLLALFGKSHEKYIYLRSLYKRAFGRQVRHLRTEHCGKLNLCSNLLTLITTGSKFTWCNLPNTLVELRICNNTRLPKKYPNNLRTLVLDSNYKHINDLPDSLEILDLTHYNFPVSKLPFNLKVLILENFDHFLSPHVLKQTQLEYLFLGDTFNCPINLDVLASSLKGVFFGDMFNQPIQLNNLVQLKKLEFGYNFNQEIQLNNLKKLTYLKFGYHFNRVLFLNKLDSLESLELGRGFRHYLYDEILYRKYKYLIKFIFLSLFHFLFCVNLLGYIADCIVLILRYKYFYNCLSPINFIMTIILICCSRFSGDIIVFCVIFVSLIFCADSGYLFSVHFYTICLLIDWSSSIVNRLFYIVLSKLMFHVAVKRMLKIAYMKCSYLPPNIKIFITNGQYSPFHISVIPDSVTHLSVINCYDCPLVENFINNSVISDMVIFKFINKMLSIKRLPKNLKYLKLGKYFNKRIYKHHLPTSLEELVVDVHYPYMQELNALSIDMNFKLSI